MANATITGWVKVKIIEEVLVQARTLPGRAPIGAQECRLLALCIMYSTSLDSLPLLLLAIQCFVGQYNPSTVKCSLHRPTCRSSCLYTVNPPPTPRSTLHPSIYSRSNSPPCLPTLSSRSRNELVLDMWQWYGLSGTCHTSSFDQSYSKSRRPNNSMQSNKPLHISLARQTSSGSTS